MRRCKNGCGKELTKYQKSYCSPACRIEGIKLRWTDDKRVLESKRAKRQWSDPIARLAAAERANKYWSSPEARLWRSELTKQQFADPKARLLAVKNTKRQWENNLGLKDFHSKLRKRYWSDPNYRRDVVSKIKRAWLDPAYRAAQVTQGKEHLKMRNANGTISSIELTLHTMLYSMGITFKHNTVASAIGSDREWDCVDFTHKIIFEADGCFWHNCPKHGRGLVWNVKGDKSRVCIIAKARKMGWRFVRVWEHDLKTGVALQKIDRLVNG